MQYLHLLVELCSILALLAPYNVFCISSVCSPVAGTSQLLVNPSLPRCCHPRSPWASSASSLHTVSLFYDNHKCKYAWPENNIWSSVSQHNNIDIVFKSLRLLLMKVKIKMCVTYLRVNVEFQPSLGDSLLYAFAVRGVACGSPAALAVIH